MITYPLELPGIPRIRRISLMGESRVGMFASPFTSQPQVQEYQGDRWAASVTLHEMDRAPAEEWAAFFLSLNGKLGTFLMGDPAGKIPRGSVLGTPLVDGGGQTGKELLTKGWIANSTGIFLAGDYIQSGTGVTTRLHKNLKDVDADGSGNATLDLYPRLRESPADNDSIIVSDCKGTFRLADNVTRIEIERSKIYGFAFNAVEAL